MLWGMVKAANGGMKGLNRQVEEKMCDGYVQNGGYALLFG